MVKLIIKNGYIKGGNSKASLHLSYLVKYIATRKGAQKIKIDNSNAPSTTQQKKLIEKLICEFKSSKNTYEYEDYIKNPTISNASEFINITLEDNLNLISDNKKYLNYIACRPRVQIIETHGLFNNSEEKINLTKVAKELSEFSGNVWTPIISLRREDASLTTYDNAQMWKNLISSKVFEIADCFKIHPDNFKFYASFHNESHHPHVHLICYSKNPNEGYLTKDGIKKMRSIFTNEIFKEELTHLYKLKTKRRDELKKEVLKEISKLSELDFENYSSDEKLEELILSLNEKLKNTTGKKQYGYLPLSTKKIVDKIVDEFSENENIKSAYKLWCDIQNDIYSNYKEYTPEDIPLSKQKEFKSIKNMIISEVIKLEIDANISDEVTPNIVNYNEDIIEIKERYYKYSESNKSEIITTKENTVVSESHNQSKIKHSTKALNLCVLSLLKNISNTFQDKLTKSLPTPKIDSKSLAKLREKKKALGLRHTGEEYSNEQDYKY